jgi:hypothetical protein
VPVCVNVTEYVPPLESAGELQDTADPSSLVVVWDVESWLVQVTVEPMGTVSGVGLKAKFWMVTDAESATAGRANRNPARATKRAAVSLTR